MLANGHIASDDYVRWAMDQYELPSVNDQYFSVPADRVYWEAVKHDFAWTPTFFPLADWQGVMLIGCVEPPSFHFPIHSPHRFVIASVIALETRYRELELVQTILNHGADHHDDHDFSPAGEDLHTPHASARQRSTDEFIADDLPAAPNVNMRDPEGMIVDVDESSNVNLFIVPEGMTADQVGRPVPNTPDGLEPQSAVIDMDALDFSDGAPIASPIIISTVTPPRAPIVPPGPPSAVVQAQAQAAAIALRSEILILAPPSPPPIPDSAGSNVSISEPAISLATCSNSDSLTASTVAHINLHFEHALLLVYENSVLRPKKWSELLLSVKGENADAISLNEPSIFRVAARTSLPYHGYVVANPTNIAFFNAFTRGVLPKHVTVMPVMIAGHLVAMLMGISTVDVDYKASLSAMEKIASDFSTQLERVRFKKAA